MPHTIARRALLSLSLVAAPLAAQRPTPAPSAAGFTMAAVKSNPFPSDLTAARAAARIAWVFNEEGKRNIWVAEGPTWGARKVTAFDEDDGQELTSVQLSPDGAWVVFVRGGEHGGNWDGPPPNPASMPTAPKVQLWAVPLGGGAARVLADGGDDPVIAPSGDRVAFVRGGQAWVAPIDGSGAATPLFATRGISDLQWSPDGGRLAFVSQRGDHAFIGIFSGVASPLQWISPGLSRDDSPRWSPDGGSLAFVRRPGAGGAPEPMGEDRHRPWGIWVAEVASGAARRVWQAPETPRGSPPATHGGTNLRFAALGRVTFVSYEDGWPHLYSVPAAGGAALRLTTGDYMVEHVTLSTDGRFLLASANAGSAPEDIDRRHVLRVPVDRAAVEVVTAGTGLEWTPVGLPGGALAYISATAQRPPLPTVRPAGGAPQLVAADRVPATFPTAALVTPRPWIYRASDGVTVHAQWFERAGGAARKPVVIFAHGGPPRQMLLGWHYSDYYSATYAMNQYLASRGFIVVSVNYRLGIGYGYDFHRPRAAGIDGASEYLDIKAAAEQLAKDPRVDASRIGIYGGSYGGYLTALALGRDSQLFAAGVDIHGVHDFTSDGGSRFGMGSWRYERSAEELAAAAQRAWGSSPVSAVSSWTSPVLLIHADDDRNVRFAQTVDLAARLRAKGVPVEELVIPDDTHHWMRHGNGVRVYGAAAEYLERMMGVGRR